MKPKIILIILMFLLIHFSSFIMVEKALSAWNVESSPTSVTLNDVWGASANDVYAVGGEETIVHYDGTGWSTIRTNTSGPNLKSIWGSSGSNVFAVGDTGTILKYDGSNWNVESPLTTINLNGVWVSSDGYVFVVGDQDFPPPYEAVIFYYDGADWSQMDSNATSSLRAVWGTSANDVFAVGDSGVIVRYDGSTWSPMNSGTTNSLASIWGSSDTNVLTSGSSTNVYTYDGNASNNWTQTVGVVEYPDDLWGSADNDVYAVGGSPAKTIYRFDGNNWALVLFQQPDTYEPPEFPHGVWGSSRYEVIVVGNNGMIVRYSQVHVQSVSPTNGALDVPVGVTISVTFSHNMNSQTIRTDTFKLMDGSNDIAGTITFPDASTAIFSPDTDLEYGKTYTVVLTTDVQDIADNPLESEYSWSFETNLSAGTSPDKPTAVDPLDEGTEDDGANVTLVASAYNDADGDSHLASHWEVKRADTQEIRYYRRNTDLESHLISDTLAAGLKYSWKVWYEDSDFYESLPSEDFVFKVGTPVPESLPVIAAGKNLGDFGMISIVHWPDDPSPQAVFNIDYDPVNYRIGTYNAMTGSYIEFGEGVEIEPGRAYWILAREGLTVNFDGIPVSTADVYVKLDYNETTLNGWNMVAPPNNADYYWANVTVVDSTLTPLGTVQSLTDGTIIDQTLWSWENGYVPETPDDNPIMEAYAGYWVEAKQAGLFLKFDSAARVSPPLGRSDTRLAKAWHNTKKWFKNLNLFSGEAIADNNSPPMPPAVLDDNTVDPVFGGCFIELSDN